jgi:hypothetical protein
MEDIPKIITKRNFSQKDISNSKIMPNKNSEEKMEEIDPELLKEFSELKENSKINIKFGFFARKRSNSFEVVKSDDDFSNSKVKKIKFDEWIESQKDNNKTLEENVLKLLIDIFEKRHKIYPNNVCSLSQYALKFMKFIENFCSEYYELSLYALYVLNSQFESFFQYISKNIDFKKLTLLGTENINEMLYYFGKDLIKIFQSACDRCDKFNFSSILISGLEDYLIKNKIIKDKKNKKIALYKEKNNFEKYINRVNDVMFLNEYDPNFSDLIPILCDIDNTEKEQSSNNKIINDKKENTTSNENTNYINENENKNNTIQNYNIEDLVNYINEPKANENKKKRKKKKKNKHTNQENEEIVINEEDNQEFLEFKNYLKENTTKNENLTKIKPIYSEEFLQKILKFDE